MVVWLKTLKSGVICLKLELEAPKYTESWRIIDLQVCRQQPPYKIDTEQLEYIIDAGAQFQVCFTVKCFEKSRIVIDRLVFIGQ